MNHLAAFLLRLAAVSCRDRGPAPRNVRLGIVLLLAAQCYEEGTEYAGWISEGHDA